MEVGRAKGVNNWDVFQGEGGACMMKRMALYTPTPHILPSATTGFKTAWAKDAINEVGSAELS